MKSFLISLTFLAALVIGAAFNCNYVTDILSYTNNTLSQLCLDAGKISNDSFSEKAVAILDFWNSKKSFLSFSINDAELRDCTIALQNLSEFSFSDDISQRNASLREAKSRIDTLFRRENFSFVNIL